MLICIVDRSGAGGGGSVAGGNVGAGSGTGAAGGAVAQAAICSARSKINSLAKSVTEPDAHYVDLGRPEPASSYVQFVKIFDGTDINAKIIPIIDLRAAHVTRCLAGRVAHVCGRHRYAWRTNLPATYRHRAHR